VFVRNLFLVDEIFVSYTTVLFTSFLAKVLPNCWQFQDACNTELIQIVIRDGVKEVSAQMLYKVLSQITDRGKEKRKRDEAGVVLTILLLAKMSGEGGMSGMVQWARLRKAWLQSHLPLGRVMVQGYVTGC
jgi:hypothetical protein